MRKNLNGLYDGRTLLGLTLREVGDMIGLDQATIMRMERRKVWDDQRMRDNARVLCEALQREAADQGRPAAVFAFEVLLPEAATTDPARLRPVTGIAQLKEMSSLPH